MTEYEDTTVTWVNSVHCAGCGKHLGIFTVAIPDDYVAPPEPTFPYEEEGCPTCLLREEIVNPQTPMAERPVGMRGPVKDRYRA